MMTQIDDGGGQIARRNARPRSFAARLALAASPTFIGMAVITALQGEDNAALLCSSTHRSPLGGMTAMYLLMALFHLAPWVSMIRTSWAIGFGKPVDTA